MKRSARARWKGKRMFICTPPPEGGHQRRTPKFCTMARCLCGLRDRTGWKKPCRMDSYHFAHRQMRECDHQLESFLVSLPARTLDIPNMPDDTSVGAQISAWRVN